MSRRAFASDADEGIQSLGAYDVVLDRKLTRP